MIFGIGQAMARESARIEESLKVLILDLSDVTYLDSTIGLSIENMVKDALEKEIQVYMTGLKERDKELLSTFALLDLVELRGTRLEALQDLSPGFES
jgi:SulP family sulfate permease